MMNEMGHCIHGAYIDSLKLEVRNEWERAEDWRNQARRYKHLLEMLSDDVFQIHEDARAAFYDQSKDPFHHHNVQAKLGQIMKFAQSWVEIIGNELESMP